MAFFNECLPSYLKGNSRQFTNGPTKPNSVPNCIARFFAEKTGPEAKIIKETPRSDPISEAKHKTEPKAKKPEEPEKAKKPNNDESKTDEEEPIDYAALRQKAGFWGKLGNFLFFGTIAAYIAAYIAYKKHASDYGNRILF